LSPGTIGRWERSDSRAALPEWLDLAVTRLEAGVDAYEPTAEPPSGVDAVPDLSALSRLGSLPRESTTFIGREHEIAACLALLARSRIVTLTGPGGVGTTRLALRVAADAQGDYRDGVCLVELAALADPARTTGS